MNIEKILYATDFSPDSEYALDYASMLARTAEATLLIAHVDDTTPGLVLGDVGYGYIPEVDAIAQEEYEQLKTVVPVGDDVAYEHCFFRGAAADGILQIAEEQRADLIVIGTHGRTGLKKVLLGSVAETVLSRTPCAVMVVRQPDDDAK